MAKRPEGYEQDKELPAVGVARKVSGRMAARDKYNYSDKRGTPTEHCGTEDTWWPEGGCSMYRHPHRCTLVGGFIATRGKCDRWDPKE